MAAQLRPSRQSNRCNPFPLYEFKTRQHPQLHTKGVSFRVRHPPPLHVVLHVLHEPSPRRRMNQAINISLQKLIHRFVRSKFSPRVTNLMKSFLRNPGFLMAEALLLCCVSVCAQTNPVSPRITQAVDETNLVPLRGNVHPLAQGKYDQGPVSDDKLMNRMLLPLQRSDEQEASLKQLLEAQQVKSSANYHQWLTPEEFGKQFGPADPDIQALTDWLTSQGFQGIKAAAGRVVIEFSGTAGQVRRAFHTEIHNYLVNGEERFANATDPQIPAALVSVVAGVVSVHNFPKQSQIHRLGTFNRTKKTGEVQPELTYINCGSTGTLPCYALGPSDFATIYNVQKLWDAGIDGTG